MDFSTDGIINRYKDKDFADILIGLTKEVEHLSNLRHKDAFLKHHQITEDTLDYYYQNCDNLLTFINSGIMTNQIMVFRPIIENLIEKDQLKKSAKI